MNAIFEEAIRVYRRSLLFSIFVARVQFNSIQPPSIVAAVQLLFTRRSSAFSLLFHLDDEILGPMTTRPKNTRKRQKQAKLSLLVARHSQTVNGWIASVAGDRGTDKFKVVAVGGRFLIPKRLKKRSTS